MAEPGSLRSAVYRKNPARGATRGNQIGAFVRFAPDVFDEIRARARLAGTSFAEEVRLLVEWGLEQ